MLKTGLKIYLASKSPRRRKLLKQLGIKFTSLSVDLNEEILDGEHPVATVKRLALHKSDSAVPKIKNGIVITADTIVVLKNEIIGKPENRDDAFNILTKLSGKTHKVYTGFVVRNLATKKKITGYEKTDVTFRKLLPDEIRDYIKTGSPMDKAGAYGIQDDFGAVFVKKIDGCYYNVVGLPLQKVYKALLEIL
ncbi:MAG: septum formation protein Maf [Ignavibacteriae bacterium HGW-Ignavibacteriae-3]|nr:MAG: septum formation protein Maf [Ignavibacteriae bacterium HGW-Ignavibacteriae-3]